MTTFIPKSVTAHASKAGKTYWKVQTDQGEASCFDYPIVQIIEQNINKPISMYDLETNEKGFINIRPAKNKPANNFMPVVAQPVATQPQAQDNFKEARIAKDVSIYTSYAKDIFVALLDTAAKAEVDRKVLMQACVDLIKQAKTSFERTEIFEGARKSDIFQDSNPKVVQTMQG